MAQIQVEVHRFKGDYTAEEVDSALSFARGDLGRSVAAAPLELEDQIEDQYIAACGAYHLGREADALELLSSSSECSCAMFRAVSARPGSTVSFPFRGQLLSGQSGPPPEMANSESWLADLLLAIALRRQDIVDILVDVPVPILQAAPVEIAECFVDLSHALQEFLLGDDPRAPLAAFWESSQPEQLSSTPESLPRFIGVAASLEAIIAKDQTAFDQALVDMLKAFKRNFGRGNAATLVTGLFDSLASGVAVLGQQHGLLLNVQSGYMPSWLVDAPSRT